MADLTPEQMLLVADVRRMADEQATTDYTDTAILALVAQAGSAAGAAARVWQAKAGKYASLVTTSESGSSRSLSDLHKNALTMSAYYEKLGAAPAVAEVSETKYPFTMPVTRL